MKKKYFTTILIAFALSVSSAGAVLADSQPVPPVSASGAGEASQEPAADTEKPVKEETGGGSADGAGDYGNSGKRQVTSIAESDELVRNFLNDQVLDVNKRHFYDQLSRFFLGMDPCDEAGTLSFSNTLARAMDNSIELQTAKSKTAQAYFKVDEVKSSKNILLNATGNLTYSQPVPAMNINGTSIKMGEEWNWTAGVAANYLITNFGLFEDSKKAAWISYVAAKADEDRVMSDLYNSVSSSYLTSLELTGLYAVTKTAVEVRKSHLDIAKAKYEEGVSPKYDMLTTMVNLKNAEKTMVSAKKSLELSKANLKKIMGMPQDENFSVTKPPYFGLDYIGLNDAIESAYKNRSEMAQMKLALEIAKTNEDIALQGKNPSLSWTASYYRQNQVSTRREYTWSSGVSVNIPILDGGAAKARVNQAKEILKQTELQKEDLERGIAFQIKDAVLQIEEQNEQLAMAESSVDSAREAYQISFVRYKENVGTFLELDDATTNYLSALASLSSAYCAYERAQINLLYSMGILVEEVDKYADFRQNK